MAGLTKEQKAKREAKVVAGQGDSTEILLVPMITDVESFPGAPKSADVHPNEVEHFKAHGWRIAE
ncbi:hypothetical protein [Flyfo siphovirus Tbat2_3]|nr:hypothetical protein [Flyfo siphovirus Tbat2_3]